MNEGKISTKNNLKIMTTKLIFFNFYVIVKNSSTGHRDP